MSNLDCPSLRESDSPTSALPLVSLNGQFLHAVLLHRPLFLVYTDGQKVREGANRIAVPQEEEFYAHAAPKSGHLAEDVEVEPFSEADWK